MTDEKKKRLEAAGWKVGGAAEFLELTPQEEAIVETSLILSQFVRAKREERGLTQTQFADLLGKKQPQVVRLETGQGVSFEAQFAALFALGVSPHEIGERLAAVSLKVAPKILERELVA